MWTTPRDMGPGSGPDSMHFFFAESPVGRSLVPISLSAIAWPRQRRTTAGRVARRRSDPRIPIEDAFANHTTDLVVTPQGGQTEAFLFVYAGIQQLLFRALEFRPAPVFDRFVR